MALQVLDNLTPLLTESNLQHNDLNDDIYCLVTTSVLARYLLPCRHLLRPSMTCAQAPVLNFQHIDIFVRFLCMFSPECILHLNIFITLHFLFHKIRCSINLSSICSSCSEVRDVTCLLFLTEAPSSSYIS